MKEKELKERTKQFAHNIVKLALLLPNDKLGNHLQGQLIRSSTSVAANYRATCVAQSKRSFVSKLGIVVEEVDESLFWLEFIRDENLLKYEDLNSLLLEATELTAIFIASRKTAQLSIKN